MDDAERVRRLQSAGQGESDVQELFQREGAARREQIRQGLPLDQLQDQEMQTLDLLHGMEGDDVRVIESGDRPRLSLETLQMARLRGQLRGEHLEGDAPAEAQVLGEKDLSHSTLAEPLEHLVMSERLSSEVHSDPLIPLNRKFYIRRGEETHSALLP